MAKAKDGDRFVVLHQSVGSGQGGRATSRGDVATAAELAPTKDGHVDEAALQRLLDLRAIAPYGTPEADAALTGEE